MLIFFWRVNEALKDSKLLVYLFISYLNFINKLLLIYILLSLNYYSVAFGTRVASNSLVAAKKTTAKTALMQEITNGARSQ